MADSSNPYAQFAPQPAASAPAGGENPYAQFAPDAAQSTESPLLRKAKVIGSGLVRGAASLPAMIGDALYGMGTSATQMPDDVYEATRPRMTENVQGVDVKNKTNGERWASSISEGVGGAVAGPGGLLAPVRNAIVGAGAGTGAEVGERIAPGNPLARVAGSIAGGVGTGVAANAKKLIYPNAEELAQKAMRDISPEDLTKAQMLQALARKNNVDLDLAQAVNAISGKGNTLAAIRDKLAASEHGTKTQNMLTLQPKQLEIEADRLVGSLHGPDWSTQQAANAVTEAATKRVRNVEQGRTAQTQPLYNQAGNLPDNAAQTAIALIERQLGQPGTTAATREAGLKTIVELKARTTDSTLPLHAADADEIVRSLRGSFKGDPMRKPDAKADYQVGQLADAVDSAIPQSDAILKARALHSTLSRDVVDPLKQGPVGQMAGIGGYRADRQSPVARLEGLFSRGSDPAIPANQRDINAFAAEVKGIDADAFPAAAKAFIRDRINKSVEGAPGITNSGNPATAQNLYDSLFKSRAQLQGMRDTAAGVARAYGLPEADVVRGMENFATITKAATNRPASMAGMSAQEIADTAGKNIGSNAAYGASATPFWRLGRWLEDAVQGKTLRTFDELMTSPEGAKTLQKLGKLPAISGKAQTLLGTFFSTPATVPTESN